jgi:hypothetical protein
MDLNGPTPYGLLAVGGANRPPPAADPLPAEAWWRAASHGHWWPHATLLPPVMLAEDPSRWCAGGGLRPGRLNAAALARAALLALPPGTPCPPLVMLVVAGPVAPHAWRVAEGGVAVAPGRRVRRYAALPAAAPLGAWVHELAHLLLGWPDLPDSNCLMGQGAAAAAAPNPALARAAGWLRLLQPDPRMPVVALTPGLAVDLPWPGGALLLTRDGTAVHVHLRDHPGPPVARLPVADPAAPLLSLLAGLPHTMSRASRPMA